MPDSLDLTSLTAHLVVSYLQGNSVPPEELPNLIRMIRTTLEMVQIPQSKEIVPQQPAVSIKKSITPGTLICLECGERKQMLKRHLRTAHGLSPEDYRSKWSLPSDYPMTAPGYAGVRSELAKKMGLGHNQVEPHKAEHSEDVPASSPSGHKYPPSRWSKPN